MRRPRLVTMLSVAAAAVGCELAEVAAPRQEDVMIVEAVLRAGADRQIILLHRSLAGAVVPGVPGAAVAVTPVADGHPIVFEESELANCVTDPVNGGDPPDLTYDATCYVSPLDAGAFVVPGETYDLRIEAPDGAVALGRTTVPGRFEFRTPAVDVDPVRLSATCKLPDRPFDLAWTRSDGAWAYITALRLSNWGDDLAADGVDVPSPLDLSSVSVSAADTTLAFPENVGLFQRFDLDQRIFQALRDGVPEDADATLVVLAADRNYTNAVRGGRFNPSGAVRGSSVTGDGVGVFGALVPLEIRSPSPDPFFPLPSCPVPDA